MQAPLPPNQNASEQALSDGQILPWERFISWERWFPLALSIAFAFLMGAFLLYQESFLFAYPETEHLNRLAANALVDPGSYLISRWVQSAGQSWNPLMAALIAAGSWLPFHPLYLLWVAQSALVCALAFRLVRFFQSFRSAPLLAVALLLVSLNPLFWMGAFCFPSQVLTALLAIEWLNQKSERARAALHITSLALLFALSFCGALGFCVAALLALEESAAVLQGKQGNRLAANVACPLLPAILFYALATASSGALGGGRLLGYPSAFSAFDVHSVLLGVWSENFRGVLLWISNGFARDWTGFPLYGFLAGYGIIGSFAKPNAGPVRSIALLLAFFAFVLPNAFPASDPEMYFFAAMLASLFAALGILQLSDAFPFSKISAQLGLAIVVGFWGIVQFPFDIDRASRRAEYVQAIHTQLSSVASNQHKDGLIAVRFIPSLFAQSGHANHWVPYPMALEHAYQIKNQERPGVGISLRTSLALRPETVVWFPTFEEASQGITASELPSSQEWNALKRTYQLAQVQYVSVFTLRDEAQGMTAPSEGLRIAHAVDSKTGRSVRQLECQPDISSKTKDWLAWDFESRRFIANAMGFSFLSLHKSEDSPQGIGHASSSGAYGMLQSEPFVIEGDQIEFYADLPLSATASLFCLAVKQSQPFGRDLRFQQAKHIFDREPDQSLMEDTFYYIQPSELRHEMDRVEGWQVVRVLQNPGASGWRHYEWLAWPWKNRQAIWLLADRNALAPVRLDDVRQSALPRGHYWNFEDGAYENWRRWGGAFGDAPATGRFPGQAPIIGSEGNYLINTFLGGSDAHVGRLESNPFVLEFSTMSFWIGGGNDMENVFVGVWHDGNYALKATGKQSEALEKIEWNLGTLLGKTIEVHIIDQSDRPWGHILADDIRIYDEPIKGM